MLLHKMCSLPKLNFQPLIDFLLWVVIEEMSLGETYKVNRTNNVTQGYTKFKQRTHENNGRLRFNYYLVMFRTYCRIKFHIIFPIFHYLSPSS
jgi:hypothetical protein